MTFELGLFGQIVKNPTGQNGLFPKNNKVQIFKNGTESIP